MDHNSPTPPVRNEFADAPAPPIKSAGKDYTVPIVITVVCLFLGLVVAAGIGGLFFMRMKVETQYERVLIEQERAVRAEMQAMEDAMIEAQAAQEVIETTVDGEVLQRAGDVSEGTAVEAAP